MEDFIIEKPIIRNKYRVKIQQICPDMPKHELHITNENTVLGISVNSAAIMENKISAVFNFLNKKGLTEINLLIGDSLYEYTAMIKHGCKEEEGKRIALEDSKSVIERFTSYMNDSEKPYRLNFILSSTMEKEEDFLIHYENIWNLFETNIDFKKSVFNFSQYYLSRVMEGYEYAIDDNFKQYTYKYLIKELAIFAILNKKGFNTLIYPGVIQTIYDILTMGYPYLSELYKNYIFVSLQIKK